MLWKSAPVTCSWKKWDTFCPRRPCWLLFGNPKRRSETIRFYLKLSLAIVAAAAVAVLEIITLAPLGAAIITGALLLTSGMILRQLLPLDE